MTRFILVRHGQTAWNREDRFRGQSDVPLDETGLAQATMTARRIAAEWAPVAVYSSPLHRARQTAQAIAQPLGLPVQPHAGLNDINFGLLQGLTVPQAADRWPLVVHDWFNAPHLAQLPEGETLAEISRRALAAVKDLAARHPDDAIVLVGHLVLNRVVLLGITGLGLDRFWRIGQDTCAINVFDAGDGDFTLLTLNDTCHLRWAHATVDGENGVRKAQG
jgi:broad specificity phosphatase PhoE